MKNSNNHSKILLILLGLLLFAFSVGMAATPVPFPHYETFKLDNGLQVYVFENHQVPQVDVKLFYRVGSLDEVDGQTGIAHFLEHIMFLGTTSLPKNRIHSLFKEAGGYCNAMTSYDYTAYYVNQLPAKKLELAIAIEADRMKNLQLDATEIQRERGVVLQERRMRIEDNPLSLAMEKIKETAFSGSPLAHSVIGRSADVSELTLAQLQKFYQQYYSPDNAILSVVGDVNTAEVQRLVQKHFGAFKSSGVQRNNWIFLEQRAERRVTEYISSNIAYLTMFYPAPQGNHDDIPALNMLLEILINKSNSRVEQNLQISRGLSNGAYGYVMPSPQQSYIQLIFIPARPEDITLLENGFYSELQRIIDEGVKPGELAAEKKKVLKEILECTEETADIADCIVGDALSYGSPDLYQHQLQIYENITPEKIVEVAKRYFTAEHRTVGYILPKSSEEGQQ